MLDDLRAIGSAGAEVWAAGDAGLVRWTGGGVDEHRPSTGFTAVAGTAAGDVFATTVANQVWRWNGERWGQVATPAGAAVSTVITAGDQVLLVGSGVHRWEVDDWVVELAPEPGVIWQHAAVDAGGDVWLAGQAAGAPRAARRTVDGWAAIAPPANPACGLAAGAEVWATSYQVARWDGDGWLAVGTPPEVTWPICAAAVGGDRTWFVDGLGAVWVRDASGAWLTEPATRQGQRMAIHAAPSGIWAAGSHGQLLRRQP
jgi:hypothetical protein